MTAIAPLLTLDEAAQRLNRAVKTSALRSAIDAGRLAAVRIGRQWLVSEADLATYVEDLKQCRNQTKGRACASTAQTASMAPAQRPDFASTSGISSGTSTAASASVRQALASAQRLKKKTAPSPGIFPPARAANDLSPAGR
ncbi:MAG: helix-turn-helix domain-containing protein [Alphaproteobacteria bacterium]|nr:helix-turn-helix domain-containing protein [Alphaproteobacteria bacterium]